MPRVFNTVFAVFLIGLVFPIFTTFGSKSTPVRIYLVIAVVPVLLLAAMALASAIRPGSLGRLLRRTRNRRRQ